MLHFYIHSALFQVYQDTITLLLLPKAIDQIYRGNDSWKERWSSKHFGELNPGRHTQVPYANHLTTLSIPRNTVIIKKKLYCMFYQLLRVQHSCSSTQSWGSVLPSIVEMRDQNSRGCPLLFSNRNLGSFCVQGTEILYTHSLWEVVDHSRSKMHFTCLIIIHDPSRDQAGIEPGTFGLADECSTTGLTLLL